MRSFSRGRQRPRALLLSYCPTRRKPSVTLVTTQGDATLCAVVFRKITVFREKTIMQRRILIGLCAFFVLACAAFAKDKSSKVKPETGTMPVTASSSKGRGLYQKGMEDYENLYLERCNEDWRAAVKEDPSIAVAWAWIAFNS